jgi:hypothetical protein
VGSCRRGSENTSNKNTSEVYSKILESECAVLPLGNKRDGASEDTTAIVFQARNVRKWQSIEKFFKRSHIQNKKKGPSIMQLIVSS